MLIIHCRTYEQLELSEASGEGEQEHWFGEGGCLESTKRVGVGEIAVRVG